MEPWNGWLGDCLLLVARCCLALVFAVSAVSKFRQASDEVAMLTDLRIPAPERVMGLIGVCESVGVLALVFGIYVQLVSVLLAIFLVVVTFAVLRFWSAVDDPPTRTQKLNSFVANIGIVGGLIYVIVAGPGRISIM